MAFSLKQMVKQRHGPPRRLLSDRMEECLNAEGWYRVEKMTTLQTV